MTELTELPDSASIVEFTKYAIQEASVDAFFSPLALAERYQVNVKPKFNTACWSWLPPHNIYVGLSILDERHQHLSDAEKVGYLKSFVRHELAHAHYTVRDLAKVNVDLARIRAPFRLFNLFEDGRIEDRYRIEAEYRFNWLLYEKLTFSTAPTALLFALVQAEGDARVVKRFLKGVTDLTVRPAEVREEALSILTRVESFYRRIIGAQSSEALYPILADWLKEFGKPPIDVPCRGNEPGTGKDPAEGTATEAGEPGEAGQGGEDEEKGDLILGALLQSDPDFREKFEADISSVDLGTSSPDDVVDDKLRPHEDIEPSNLAPDAQLGTVLSSISTQVDPGETARLVERFKKFFQTKSRRITTEVPQKKISLKHAMLGLPPFRKKVLTGRGCQELLLVVDCSGSMGVCISQAKLLISALSALTRMGHVRGSVLLTAVRGKVPVWERWSLPMEDEIIARVQAWANGEGIEPALMANIKQAAAADYVFVYTDAQINDNAINKQRLHARGVYTWGLYAGPVSHLDKLRKYFDKAIIRDSALELVDAIIVSR